MFYFIYWIIWQISGGILNTNSLRYSLNDEFSREIKTQCGSIHDTDECDFAAKLQKCIQEIIKTTPID